MLYFVSLSLSLGVAYRKEKDKTLFPSSDLQREMGRGKWGHHASA